MKKIYGYAALFAAMSLASCSSDNEPNVVNSGAREDVYLAVNIAAAGENTRADYSDPNAIKGENTVDHAAFVLFDAQGKVVTVANNVRLNAFKDGTGDVTASSSNTVKISKPENAGEVKYAVCVLNSPTLTFGVGTDYTDVRDQLLNSYKNGDNFIMSNSAVVASDAKESYLTDVEGYIFETEDEASTAPAADIYVERVAARVDYTKKDSFKMEDATTSVSTDKANEKVEVSVVITGVEFTNEATQASLIKNIDGLKTEDLWSNWSETHRTHWANVFATPELKNFPLSGDHPAFVDDKTVNTYMCENTDEKNLTSIVLTAKLQIDGKDISEDECIYRVMGNGNYYNQKGMENIILTFLSNDGYRKSSDGVNFYTLDVDDFKLEAGHNTYDEYVQIALNNSADKLYKDGEEVTNVATENAALKGTADNKAKRYRVYRYTDGLCYYYATLQNDVAKKGVVRNHIYSVELNGINGLGIPMFDPSKNVIPEDPDPYEKEEVNSWYLNASINILNWKLYTQGVIFDHNK